MKACQARALYRTQRPAGLIESRTRTVLIAAATSTQAPSFLLRLDLRQAIVTLSISPSTDIWITLFGISRNL